MSIASLAMSTAHRALYTTSVLHGWLCPLHIENYRGVGGVLEVVRPKVGAAEGRFGGGSGDLPRENFVKKTQNPAFWELLAHFWHSL